MYERTEYMYNCQTHRISVIPLPMNSLIEYKIGDLYQAGLVFSVR